MSCILFHAYRNDPVRLVSDFKRCVVPEVDHLPSLQRRLAPSPRVDGLDVLVVVHSQRTRLARETGHLQWNGVARIYMYNDKTSIVCSLSQGMYLPDLCEVATSNGWSPPLPPSFRGNPVGTCGPWAAGTCTFWAWNKAHSLIGRHAGSSFPVRLTGSSRWCNRWGSSTSRRGCGGATGGGRRPQAAASGSSPRSPRAANPSRKIMPRWEMWRLCCCLFADVSNSSRVELRTFRIWIESSKGGWPQ